MQEFLEADGNYILADNYLISVALIYMSRANYVGQQYTFFNFLVALYLAHEIEEESPQIRLSIIQEAFESSRITASAFRFFMSKREKLLRTLDYNVIVKREESEYIMCTILMGNYIWRRTRGNKFMMAGGDFCG